MRITTADILTLRLPDRSRIVWVHLVSIDGRYETVYPEPVVRENLDFTRGAPGSEAFLDAYRAGYALYPRESGAARLLAEAAGWTLLDESALFVLYRRK